MNAEPERQFVDTNILVYAHDASAGEKQRRARALLEELWASQGGCLSIQVLQEFYVAVTRKVDSPLGSTEAAGLVEALSTWKVHSPTPADLLAAIELTRLRRLSLWDAQIIQSARSLGCSVLWSEDLPAELEIAGIEIKSPF